MKKLLILAMLFASLSNAQAQKKSLKFENNLESLAQYECPEWFRDAKFGIWSCWGPQTVPMQGDWYARAMYEQHSTNQNKKHVYDYHLKNYGHPSEFGYKDLIPFWKAENFDPEALMKLFKDAGAKYFVSIACHHDNYDLWDSKFTRWDAVEVGPKRDIIAAWKDAADKYKMRFGLSEHLSAGYGWWQSNKKSDEDGDKAGVPYDGSDPKNWDLYYSESTQHDGWVTNNGMFAQLWLARMTDLLDNYEPDVFYSDGALPFGYYGETMLANYYNNDVKKNKGKLEAVYLSKPARHNKGWEVYDPEIGVEDRERGGLAEIGKYPWQTDTSIGDWYYNKNWRTEDTDSMYRSPFWVISTLVDVVSKNGNMLLNVVQRPDGTVDKEVVELLEAVGDWMEINDESIFETRPWEIYGEGPQKREGVNDWKEDFEYTAQDIRYTRDKADKVLYATAMGMPKSDIVLREVAKRGREIKSISLLGSKERLNWSQTNIAVTISKPDFSNSLIVPVFKIRWK
ncbi:MAG: alpha-L-fucosidase [Rikenellaceae bacterium]